MSTRIRSNPVIPDHDVLRKIGGGAYGEVWLARGVTGAMRAVKVVWREDFEDERTFEREFEGILKYEPISRDHPALVNILHVGRSSGAEETFYYYVMELGDDVHTGRDINPVEYEPRTLRAEHHTGPGEQWPVDECLDVGLRLAEALQHLHQNGLAHRDVKPSNVIFVNGRAKLADIGLVAARGQRTFVGTEGFVPPEGPGSAQADIYSLGKVLYEIATGMDRMNFPELPEDMPAEGDRKLWLELNRVICEICEPRISKRKISTAAALAESLRRLQRGKKHRRGALSLVLTALMLASVGGLISWQIVKDSEWVERLRVGPGDAGPVMGMVKVISLPEGADVWDAGGNYVGTTPMQTMEFPVGETVRFTLQKENFRPLVLEGLVRMIDVHEPLFLFGQMKKFSPPQVGEPWVDQLDNVYQPVDRSHVSSQFVSKAVWDGPAAEMKLGKSHYEWVEASENGQPTEVVLTSEKHAAMFCRWLHDTGIREGYLTEEHEVKPLMERSFKHPAMSERAINQQLRPFRIQVRKVTYGQVYVTTEPPGAELFINGIAKGITHGELIVPHVRPGRIQLLLVLEGYKPMSKSYDLKEGQLLEVHLTLRKNKGVVFGRSWQNELGMKFEPVGRDLMVSVWETRVADYETFINESGHPTPRPPAFEQAPDHPIVNVSREDAEAFCRWLTERERKHERITQNHLYRLPTDIEWSQFVGLEGEDSAVSPAWRDSRKREVFPWGDRWDPDLVAGNFADMKAALSPDVDVDRTIADYDDGYPFTAPVGTYAANDMGLHDLSGNVHEWVSDPYSNVEGNMLGVLRGGGWNTYQMENLYSGARNAVPPGYAADSIYGFRVVLAKDPVEAVEGDE